MDSRRLKMLIVAGAAVVAVFTGCGKKEKADDPAVDLFPSGPGRTSPGAISAIPDPVARVNGEPIPGPALEAALSAALREARNRGLTPRDASSAQLPRMLLSNLIVKELTFQQGVKEGLVPSDEEARAEVERLREQFESPEAFNETLMRHGVDEDGFAEIVRKDLTSRAVLDEHVEIPPDPTDDEVRAFYDENADQFQAPDRAEVWQIFAEVPEDADEAAVEAARKRLVEARRRIEGGEEFEAVAREVSDDKQSGARGGLTGVVARGRLSEEADRAVFDSEIGVVSEPIQLPRGWTVLKVSDRREAGQVPFEDVAEQIRARLAGQSRSEALQGYVTALTEQAEIEIYLPGAALPAAGPEGETPATEEEAAPTAGAGDEEGAVPAP